MDGLEASESLHNIIAAVGGRHRGQPTGGRLGLSAHALHLARSDQKRNAGLSILATIQYLAQIARYNMASRDGMHRLEGASSETMAKSSGFQTARFATPGDRIFWPR
ncbi:hypothetical protein OF83DRAFT_702727 [Amylostereum chailletii]|nr:hypothetical protein OF83DRAFT_702727 [Amylostereum chailletii]